MQHVIMGTMLLLISVAMIVLAIVLSPKLYRLGVKRAARYSFATTMVLTGAYLGWVSTIFFSNELGPENYTPELWGIRILLLASVSHFVYAAWKC